MTDLRQQLIAAARGMEPARLNRGTSGNLSVRTVENGAAGFLITPSGLDYHKTRPQDIVQVELSTMTWEGLCKPLPAPG